MEAGRGVRCIKKPLPSSDLSPLPHTLTDTHVHTNTQTPLVSPTPSHHSSPQLKSTLYQTHGHIDAWARTITCTESKGHTFAHHQTHTHSIIRWLPWRKSEGARRRTAPQWWFCILMVPPPPPSSAPLSPQLVILVSRRLVGSKPPATSSQEDRVTQLQDSISRVRHLQMVTFDCDRLWGGSAGEQEKMGFLLACAPGDEVDCNYATKRKHRVRRGHPSTMSL